MEYFCNTFVNHPNFLPKRWLHIDRKLNQYYNVTNNLQESQNHVTKMGAIPTTITATCKHLKTTLERTIHQYENLKMNHNYQNSHLKSFKNKDNRVELQDKEIQIHDNCHKGLKEYKRSE